MEGSRFSWVAILAVLLMSCGGGDGDGAVNPPNTNDVNAPTPDVPTIDPDLSEPDVPVDPDISEEDKTLRVTSVDPSVGPAKGGEIVTIEGNAFNTNGMIITFGDSTALDVFVLDAKRLTCMTPPGNPGLVDVRVIDTEAETSAVLEYAYRYKRDVLVLSIDPNLGHVSGGEAVTISGKGLSQGDTIVLFGDKAAINVQVVDDSTVHATTPQGAGPGFVDIHVSNQQGAAVLNNGYEYFALPEVLSVSPAAGPTTGGNTVTLNGKGFAPSSTVSIGPNDVTVVNYVSATELSVVVAPGSPGPADVTVATDYGTANLANGYFYVSGAQPESVQLLSVQPMKGAAAGGQMVFITAFGLTDAADTVVTFGGSQAIVESVDSDALTVVVTTPEHEPGMVDVTLTNSTGSDTLSGAYTYEPTFHILTVNPVSGPVDGGTDITIYGAGFAEGAEVRVGALPCNGVNVVDSTTIQCTTPAGSPGAADVTVTLAEKQAILTKGFFYESGGMELFVVDPNTGSQAGGTFVRLLGAGFEEPVKVTFGELPASHITLVSSTLITAKTPPGEIGTADVTVEAGFETSVLIDGFTYFNPMSLYGGTWGPPVDGAVNVTVLDAYNGSPIPDVFVMLYTNPDTPYQGYSNGAGQITFSGPDVLGEQMVSGSKTGYESQSVIAYDATNITMYMVPIPPPSMGPPPPGAIVSGKVFGLNKYVVAPPKDCNVVSKVGLPAGLCSPCETNDDCPPVLQSCTIIGETGSFCTQACAADTDCPSGFACLNVGGTGTPQCVPTPGKKQARCYITTSSMWSRQYAEEDLLPSRIADANGLWSHPSRLGEVAIVCLGGIVAWDDPTDFTPYAFGVKRHVFVIAGENPDQNVTLNHPLSRTIRVRLDDPPFDQSIGPNYTAALVYWDFGSDGAFYRPWHQNVQYGSTGNVIAIKRQPSAWTGDVYDVTYSVMGVAFTFKGDPASQLPRSATLLTDIKHIDDDLIYTLDGGEWTAVQSGMTQTVNALYGFADNNIWGVGDNGAVVHYNGAGFSAQPSPSELHLYGVWGSGESDVWAVGEDATVAHFDGLTWSAVTGPSTTANLRAIWGAGPNDFYVAASSYAGIWHWNGTTWTKQSVSGADLRDMHGAASDAIWAVGRNGAIRHWDGTSWKYQSAGGSYHLMSVHAVSKTEAYAVGTEGTILHWNGTNWQSQSSPTNRALRAVWARGPMDVYAVGDTAVLLHYDGNSWVDYSDVAIEQHALLALWGDPTTGKGVSAGSSELFMGPMLQVPYNQDPADGGLMQGYHVAFDVKPGVPAHFNYLKVGIPSLFGDIPVWSITTDGDVFDFDLPDVSNIAGTPGIAQGFYKLTILRVYKDDFDINNYDLSELSTKRWRSWAVDVTYFNK
jgi:hypothetical protein